MTGDIKTIKSYYTNGNLANEFSILNDKKHGLESTYLENGSLRYQTLYIHGVNFFTNSNISEIFIFVNFTKKNEIDKICFNESDGGYGELQIKKNEIKGICNYIKYDDYFIYSMANNKEHGIVINFKLKNKKNKNVKR